MQHYLITLHCGGRRHCYICRSTNGCEAICAALQRLPHARRISARPITLY